MKTPLFWHFKWCHSRYKQAQDNRNNWELTDLQYLPIRTENVKYVQNMEVCTSCLFVPFKWHHSRFNQALDHKKQYRIEWSRVSTCQKRYTEYSGFLKPFKWHHSGFKQAQDHKKHGELINLEYLPVKAENVKYVQNLEACTSHLFGPFKWHYIIFKQAQDLGKQWRIEWPGVFTYQNRKK